MNGGKANSLLQLQRLGLRVPLFVVVDEVEFARDRETEIKRILTTLGGALDTRFAVRSSANLEDGTADSFAGLFESKLHVRSTDLSQAIEEVYASAKTPRVAAYLAERMLQPDALRMHVVVQVMVNADVAGVAFGADPLSGLLGYTLINAVWGLGEGLVDGSLSAEETVIGPNEKIAFRRTTVQAQMMVRAAKNGTRWAEVPTPKQGSEKLSTDQLVEVHQVLQKLETDLGQPQDVEFAFADGVLFILQARPITTLDEQLLVYDNSNIVESYPGVTSPLTFSFIEKMYAAVYRQLSAVLGVRQARINAFPEAYDTLLAHHHGRVYYNLNSWYGVLSLLPGYRLNAPAMERMMGVKESLDLPPLPQTSKLRAWLDMLGGAWGLVRSFRRLSRKRVAFKAFVEEVIVRYRTTDTAQMEDAALVAHYTAFEQVLVRKWEAPLENDFFAMIFFSTLQGLAKRFELPSAQSIHNDLLAGSGAVISTQPATQTLQLAAYIEARRVIKSALLKSSADEFWRKLKTTPEQQELREKIEAYLEAWGARTIGELKLETETHDQRPAAYIEVLQAYVKQGLTTPSSDDHAKQLRLEAEKEVAQHLHGWKRRLFNWVLKHARTLVEERENLRYERTRGFAMVRRLMLAMGERLAAQGLIAAPRDVFWLRQHEVLQALQHGQQDVLIPQVEERRNAAAQLEGNTLPERIALRGPLPVALTRLSAWSQQQTVGGTSSSPTSDRLSGIPCCPGKVRAAVRVVHDPSSLNDLNAHILVTRSTDPGWITLFPSAAAILVERGSLLSHAAIVSREFGIPCIVGIDGLLDTLRTGDVVAMDGSTGEIRVVKAAAE